MKVTDYERIASVTPTQLGQFNCPKCIGVCNEVSNPKQREWDCKKCGRGWVEIPDHLRTVSEVEAWDEKELS